jgi:hypothetical protein
VGELQHLTGVIGLNAQNAQQQRQLATFRRFRNHFQFRAGVLLC